jgi:hypothetical protein
MKRLGIVDPGSNTTTVVPASQRAAEEYFGKQQLSASNRDAVNALFPAPGKVTSSMRMIVA